VAAGKRRGDRKPRKGFLSVSTGREQRIPEKKSLKRLMGWGWVRDTWNETQVLSGRRTVVQQKLGGEKVTSVGKDGEYSCADMSIFG